MVKTWAPVGRTPIHRHVCRRRDKISVISGISVSPKRQRLNLYYYLFYDNIGQEEVVLFLRHLLRHLPGPVIVLLDNANTHKGEPLEEIRRQHPRLRLENFPAYTPELNPDEGVWRQAKRKLANSCPRILTSSWKMSSGQSTESRDRRRSCGVASRNPSCPLFCAKTLHYLYVGQ